MHSATVVGERLKRAADAGITWPLPDEMDEEALEELIYAGEEPEPSKPLPDMKLIHRELSTSLNAIVATLEVVRGP
jgi:transposase